METLGSVLGDNGSDKQGVFRQPQSISVDFKPVRLLPDIRDKFQHTLNTHEIFCILVSFFLQTLTSLQGIVFFDSFFSYTNFERY